MISSTSPTANILHMNTGIPILVPPYFQQNFSPILVTLVVLAQHIIGLYNVHCINISSNSILSVSPNGILILTVLLPQSAHHVPGTSTEDPLKVLIRDLQETFRGF